MEIVRCPNGHFYDPSQAATCPKCAQANQGGMPSGGFPKTEPVAAAPIAPTPAPAGEAFPKTEPVFASAPQPAAPVAPVAPVAPKTAPTVPVVPAPQPVKAMEYPATEPISNVSNNTPSKVQDYSPTTPVAYGYSAPAVPVTPVSAPVTPNVQPQVGFKPVVGWLVCVEGGNKGRDYRIYNGYNYIGRAQSMDICISGDQSISNENAAIVAYDDQERMFFFGPGMGHNAVRLNGKMCLGQNALNAYDEITLGQTKLLFVPLCNERFDWNDR